MQGWEALASPLLCPSGIKHEEIHGFKDAVMGTQLGTGYWSEAVAPQKWPALPTYINTYSLNLTLCNLAQNNMYFELI